MGYALLFITIVAIVVHNCLAADADRPPRIHPATCCPLPDLISDEVRENCKEFMPTISADAARRPPPPPPHHGPPMDSCFMSCVFNETGIISGTDHELNRDQLSTYLNEVLTNYTDLIPVAENAFITCSDESEKFRAKMQEKMKNRPSPPPPACPPCAALLIHCVGMESFMNCPESLWSNTKECNDMRDHMKQFKPNSIEDFN